MIWGLRTELVAVQRRCWPKRTVLLAAVILPPLLAVLSYPWGVSAYYVQKAGRLLDTGSPHDSTSLRAERSLSRAIDVLPNNAQAYGLLAKLYWQCALSTDDGEASLAGVEAQSRFVALRPRNPLGYWELAEACERLPISNLPRVAGHICGLDSESRRAVLVRLWRRAGHSAASFIRAGDEWLESEAWTQAEVFYQRALLMAPEAVEAWQGLAALGLARDDPEAALAAYGHVIALGSDPLVVAAAHSHRGEILAERQRWAEAGAELEQAIELVPDQSQYHLHYGWYLFRAGGDLDAARAALAEAARLAPETPWAYLRLADLEFSAANYDLTLEHAQAAVGLQPDLFWGWFWRGLALRRLGQLTDAEDSLRRALDLGQDTAALHAELGQVLVEVGKGQEAIDYLARAVQLAPTNIAYNLSLADAYRSTGQRTEATAAYQLVLEMDPENARARQALQELDK